MVFTFEALQYHVLDTRSLSEWEKAFYGFERTSGSHCLIYTVPLSGYPLGRFAVVCPAL